MTKPALEPDSRTVYSAPALEKGFKVIELLASAPEGLTLTEIATRLGFKSMSEIFRVIMVMERRGWLSKNPDNDRFTMTYKVLETALRAIPTHDLLLVAPPLMRELANEIEQSCHLVALNGAKGLVLARQESPGPTGFAVRRGVEIDPVRTCSGRVLMAFSDPQIVARVMAQHSPLSDMDRAQIDKVRRRGYEMMPSIRTVGVTDIACPIMGSDGFAVATLTVPFLKLIDGTQSVTDIQACTIVAKFAKRISTAIGGRN